MTVVRQAMARTGFCAAALLLTAGVSLLSQTTEAKPKVEPKRPQVSLKASQSTGMVPVRISATAELKGGDDDFQDYYCPTVEWNWGDGTISESTIDCEPYEAGKSQIRRRYTVSHAYKRSGSFKITFRLKNKDRVLTSATTVVRLVGGMY